MTFSCVVVPIKTIDIRVLVLGELMCSVTKWLVLGQAALAEIFFFAANNKLIWLTLSVFYNTCHDDSPKVFVCFSCAAMLCQLRYMAVPNLKSS